MKVMDSVIKKPLSVANYNRHKEGQQPCNVKRGVMLMIVSLVCEMILDILYFRQPTTSIRKYSTKGYSRTNNVAYEMFYDGYATLHRIVQNFLQNQTNFVLHANF